MNEELHSLILWENSRKDSEKVIESIKEKFEICQIFEIEWPKQKFVSNLKRFYGITLADPQNKKSKCGDGPFLLIIIRDQNPIDGKRKTSLGSQIVNTNIYDFKMKTRKTLGSGYSIHSSIHQKEANHDFMLLLGKSLEEISADYKNPWNGEIKELKKDLFGNYWKNPEEIFKLLNSTVNYVILRNFENFPDELISSEHADVDILTNEKFQIPFLLNMKKINSKNVGYSPLIDINGKKVKFDVRYVEDGYYDQFWAKNILKNKIKTDEGFFVPSNEDYFYSLLYHMLIHKSRIQKDYSDRLFEIIPDSIKEKYDRQDFDNLEKLMQILKNFMQKNGYKKTNSIAYSIKHNEILRLINVGIYTIKHEGWNFLFRAIRFKISKTISK
jgi:hypothetical protein